MESLSLNRNLIDTVRVRLLQNEWHLITVVDSGAVITQTYPVVGANCDSGAIATPIMCVKRTSIVCRSQLYYDSGGMVILVMCAITTSVVVWLWEPAK